MQSRLTYFILFALSVLVYIPTIKNGYSLDDEYVIQNNKNVQKGIAGIPKIFSSPYTRTYDGARSSGYRPLPVAIGAIEYQFFGENPAVSHAVNVLLYAISIALLYYFLQLIFASNYVLLPFIATLLFLFHPIHSEIVINVKSRDELLAFLFAIITWVAAIKTSKYTGKMRWGWAAVGCFSALLCMFSNPVSIVMLALTLLVLYFFTNISWIRLSLVVVSLFALIRTFDFIGKSMKQERINQLSLVWENPLYGPHTFADVLGLSAASLIKYISLLVVPYPLSHYYGYNQIPIYALNHPLHIACWLLFGGLAIWSARELYQGKTTVGFILCFFLLGILPFSNLLKYGPGIVAERWAYSASLAFCMGLALVLLHFPVGTTATWQSARQQNKWWGLCIGVGIILSGYILIIQKRIPDWKDMNTLVARDAKTVPNSAKVNATLGSLLIPQFLAANKSDAIRQKAEYHLERSLAIDSTYGPAWNNLGLFKESRGETDKAIQCFENALNYKSIDRTAIDNLGRLYVNAKRLDDLMNLYRQYLGQPNIDAQIYLDYATHLAHIGKLPEALAMNDTAQILMPQRLSVVYDNRARILYEQGDKAAALQYWEKTYQFDTTDPAPAYKLMNAYLEAGDTANALKYQYIFQTLKTNNK